MTYKKIFSTMGFTAFLALVPAMPLAFADDAKHGGLDISAAWTRATVKTAKVGGGYVTIRNNGDMPDRLVSGTADFAGRVQLHEMRFVDNVMQMRPLADGVEIPAGGEIVLKPGAQHVMFLDLQRPLVEGEEVSAVLHFEKAGDVSVTFKVNGLAAKGPESPENHGNHENHENHSGHSGHGGEDRGKHGQ